MIRNSRTFGLALVAMLALGAFVAQGAMADPLTVTNGGSGTTFYTGDQDSSEHVFNSTSEVKCKTAVFTATSTGASVSELTVTPKYENCTAFGFAGTDIKPNGCTYTFTTPTKEASQVTFGKETLHIVCAAGKAIEITPTSFGVSVCTQSVTTQTSNGGKVVGTNAGGSGETMDITLDIELSGISYTGTGGACGTAGNNATYNGKSTVRAYSDSGHTAQRGITFS